MSTVIKSIGKLIGSIMPKTPKLPEIPSMPDPGSTTAKLAARKKVDQRKKTGREGTIYSGPYQGANLGGTA